MSNICPTQNPFVFAGMTHAQLTQAFDQVANPQDWRAPICARVSEENLGTAIVAIEFFTATKATASLVDMVDGIRIYQVESIGYRAGPAGP